MKNTKIVAEQESVDRQEKVNRRTFLKQGALIGGGVAGAAVLSSEAIAAEGEAPKVEPKDEGYKLTEHVSDYYKSAQV